MLVRALEKTDAMETQPENLRFIRMDAENICNMFAEHEVDGIYLNFSDPWPKDRHAKRRLTSQTFLGRYDKILKPEGHVEFKTDNKDLFQFSLEQAEPAGWHLDAFTWDLHHDETLNQGDVYKRQAQRRSYFRRMQILQIHRRKSTMTGQVTAFLERWFILMVEDRSELPMWLPPERRSLHIRSEKSPVR